VFKYSVFTVQMIPFYCSSVFEIGVQIFRNCCSSVSVFVFKYSVFTVQVFRTSVQMFRFRCSFFSEICIEKSNERRNMLLHIAQDGIKQHLNKENFKTFEKIMLKELKKAKKESSWKSEFFNEFILQMEQLVHT